MELSKRGILIKFCVWCERELIPGDVVRFVHPSTGQVHFQLHTFPHGTSPYNTVIPQSCRKTHTPEHTHEGECTIMYCEKVGIIPPSIFETTNLIGFTDERELNVDLENYPSSSLDEEWFS